MKHELNQIQQHLLSPSCAAAAASPLSCPCLLSAVSLVHQYQGCLVPLCCPAPVAGMSLNPVPQQWLPVTAQAQTNQLSGG